MTSIVFYRKDLDSEEVELNSLVATQNKGIFWFKKMDWQVVGTSDLFVLLFTVFDYEYMRVRY